MGRSIAQGAIRRARTDVPPLAEGHRWVKDPRRVDVYWCERCCQRAKLETRWHLFRGDRWRVPTWVYAECRTGEQLANPGWTVRASRCNP